MWNTSNSPQRVRSFVYSQQISCAVPHQLSALATFIPPYWLEIVLSHWHSLLPHRHNFQLVWKSSPTIFLWLFIRTGKRLRYVSGSTWLLQFGHLISGACVARSKWSNDMSQTTSLHVWCIPSLCTPPWYSNPVLAFFPGPTVAWEQGYPGVYPFTHSQE